MMDKRRHVLSLFTKLPRPGTTKTRLTEKYGGALTEPEAAELYRASMLDVAEAAFRALELCRQGADGTDEYDFFISCTPESDLPALKAIFEAEFPRRENIHYMVDHGQNFDEHFNDHYRQLFDWGYHSVVCIGGDLATISPEFIHRSFQWLSHLERGFGNGAMVIAPCQAAGVSLVGLTRDAPMDFSGVFYNPGGTPALDNVITIAAVRQIPTAMLETQSDIDTMEDLAHTASVINAMSHVGNFQPGTCVPVRTMEWLARAGISVLTPPNDNLDPRGDIDDKS